MPDFRRRSTLPELMDDPACPPEAVRQALRELDVINTWLGGFDVTLSGLARLLALRPAPADRPLRIVDVGCGGGDMLVRIARWARRRRQPVALTGLDINPLMLDYARQRSAAYPEIDYVQADVFTGLAGLAPDIVTNCLFAHHFDDGPLARLLAHLHGAAALGLVVNDLHRHPLAYYGFRTACALFGASPMVRYDGSLSVLRALTRREWATTLTDAGLPQPELSWHWAWRWRIVVPAAA